MNPSDTFIRHVLKGFAQYVAETGLDIPEGKSEDWKHGYAAACLKIASKMIEQADRLGTDEPR